MDEIEVYVNGVKTDDIAKALRKVVVLSEGMGVIRDAAANEIESLQARLAEAERQEKQARQTCWLLVTAVGGEVRIPSSLILRMDPSAATLERYENPDGCEVVYRCSGERT